MTDETKTEKTLQSASKELKENPPAILASTRRKFGSARAESQRRAILLSKARAKGAKIPKPKSMKQEY
jgi:hypothetical protein